MQIYAWSRGLTKASYRRQKVAKRKMDPTCYLGARRCDRTGGGEPKLPFLEICQDTLSCGFFCSGLFLLCFLLERF
jgi:hypothetical protein